MLRPISSSIIPLNRREFRQTLRRFVEIKTLALHTDYRLEALTSDFSDSGVGLLTTVALPVGTKIEINQAGKLIALGEVVNIEPWDINDLAHLGIRITEVKGIWPPL